MIDKGYEEFLESIKDTKVEDVAEFTYFYCESSELFSAYDVLYYQSLISDMLDKIRSFSNIKELHEYMLSIRPELRKGFDCYLVEGLGPDEATLKELGYDGGDDELVNVHIDGFEDD